MRRGFCTTLVVVGCALTLAPSVSQGQITFIPGPQKSVPNGPQFAAAADFNNDGIGDIVTSNNVARKIAILFGSTDGSFQSGVDRQVGTSLRGVAAADFNADGNQDIVVVDFTLNLAFILAGNGNGTFNPTGNFRTDRRGPYAVATGNFDNKNGPDIVTANSFANSLTTLFNLGRNSGFVAQPNLPIGKNPRAVAVKDFNADGLDDIAVINTGGTGTDQVAIMLNNGVGSFQSVQPVNFVVGKGAAAFTVNDFNDDGVADIAVLNAAAVSLNSYTVSLLLNDTVPGPGNKPEGTGFFSVGTAFQFTCPARINLTPVTCTPRDIKSADFDGDGINDIVISVSTTSTENNSVTAGFVSAFAGRGDGGFDFSTQVLIGLGPRAMAVGDFTGDGGPDIAVDEYTNNSVRILRAVYPPGKPNGGGCRLGTQCTSTFCVDDTCCAVPSCPTGSFCNIPGHEGQCTVPGPNGSPCESGSQCESGFCVNGFCCGSRTCPGGQFCNTGQCGAPAPNGAPCNDPAQCDSLSCVDGYCCNLPDCPVGERCDIAGSEGVCTTPTSPGNPCTEDEQCTTGHCVDGVCCFTESCPSGQICNAPGNEGDCVVRPSPTRTPTATPTPQPNGASCSTGSQCTSGNCVNNVCCGSASCPTGQRCDIFDSLGSCAPRKGQGEECRVDSDCITDNCQQGSPQTCGPVRTATPTRTPTPRGPGDPCTSGDQCPDDLFCSDDEGVCCESSQCPDGQSCRVDGSEGVCTNVPTPTRTPTPKVGVGQECDPNNPDACETSLCTDNVCCDSENCDEPDRCDVFGFEGTCAPPLLEGDECAKNTDCEDPLVCAFSVDNNRFECSVPPEPTPTFIPFTPRPTDPGPDVRVSRSGGCAIGQGSDGSQIWVFCLLPLALWLRRSSLQRIRARGDERRSLE